MQSLGCGKAWIVLLVAAMLGACEKRVDRKQEADLAAKRQADAAAARAEAAALTKQLEDAMRDHMREEVDDMELVTWLYCSDDRAPGLDWARLQFYFGKWHKKHPTLGGTVGPLRLRVSVVLEHWRYFRAVRFKIDDELHDLECAFKRQTLSGVVKETCDVVASTQPRLLAALLGARTVDVRFYAQGGGGIDSDVPQDMLGCLKSVHSAWDLSTRLVKAEQAAKQD